MHQLLILEQPDSQVRVAEVNCEQHNLIIMPWEVMLRIYAGTNGPILQTGKSILYQAQFGITEQVRVDVAEGQRGRSHLSTFASHQVRENALDGGSEVWLDAGDPIGTDILTGQSLADKFHVILSHVSNDVGCGNIGIKISHLHNILD